jgi:hypothetical protein
MASPAFDSDAFSTTAFDTNAFDLVAAISGLVNMFLRRRRRDWTPKV